MIYLDNAATTYPKPESVYQKMDWANRNLAFNAGRGSYDVAKQATHLIDETRELLLKMVSAKSGEKVILTSSATEALNIIILGLNWSSGDTVYVSPYEHNAVARVLEIVRKKHNINVELLPVKPDSLEIDVEKSKYLFVKNKPKCVCCTHVSNVTGYILPVKDLFKPAKDVGAITIMDASQSFGLVDININEIHADFIAFAGHKTPYGPFGIGGFIASDCKLGVSFAGGTGSNSLNLNMPEQLPDRYEFGSKNIVSIAGLNEALKCLDSKTAFAHENDIMKYLIEKISVISDVILYQSSTDSTKQVGVLSFNVKGYKSEDVGLILDEDFGIAVRTGYHCAPYVHGLLNDEEYMGTVRVGLSQYTSADDIDALIEALKSL